MMGRKRNAAVVTTIALLAAAGCSSGSGSHTTGNQSTSSASSSSASAGTASGTASATAPTYTVGLLTDASGAGASGNGTSVQGVQAGIAWAATQGYKIKYALGDTATSPSGALSAAQKMVQQENVLAVLSVSALTFGAAPYLKSSSIPVIGVAEDATEWASDTNMFSVIGVSNPQLVPSGFGQLMKMEGGTNVGSIGYSISPGSADAAKGAAISARAAGLKAGYVNAAFPFGSTNVEPAVLAMKAAGVDSFTAATDPNTAFAFITSLRQQNVDLKFVLLDDGYGGDLEQAGPGAAQAAQGVYFQLGAEPVEMHTAATNQFVSYLRGVGVKGDPTFAEYNGYESVLLLVQALEAAGSDATRSSLLTALSGIHDFNAGGLLGAQKLDINDRSGQGPGLLGCGFVTRYVGSTFQLVKGGDPICSTILPQKVS